MDQKYALHIMKCQILPNLGITCTISSLNAQAFASKTSTALGSRLSLTVSFATCLAAEQIWMKPFAKTVTVANKDVKGLSQFAGYKF